MRLPIIRVRDKTNGKIHVVGSNTHDTLYVDENGNIHYYNLQNGEGTGKNSDYEFVGKDNGFCETSIEFRTIEGFGEQND